MEKYLGNKRAILPEILSFADAHCGTYGAVCDIFSGTTNVARSFRRRGKRVFANDANRFSYVLGQTYLNLRAYPKFDRLPKSELRVNDSIVELLESQFLAAAARDGDSLFPLDRATDIWKRLAAGVGVIATLNGLRGSKLSGPRHIEKYYTVFGDQSQFHSVRGTTGRRNYFSRENARHLDAVLTKISQWWRRGWLTEAEIYFLLTSVIEEVVIVANVNGTFHDFNRQRLWPNSLQEALFRVPLTYPAAQASLVRCGDSLDVIEALPDHDVLYIDPPYNFRQYGAYYHFLNFIAAYPFLDSPAKYLRDIDFVRGQNPLDDFTSDFSFRDRFVEAMRTLISRSRSRFVILSYYGGRNHWNHWTRGEERFDVGREILTPLFSDSSLFSDSTFHSVKDARKNYQSRNGERKATVDEYLFVGERTEQRTARCRQPASKLFGVNQRWGLANFR